MKNQRWTLNSDANAGNTSSFGGQFGTGRPNYNGNINFRHRF